MSRLFVVVVCAMSAALPQAMKQRQESQLSANPIRKVVTMLQMMTKKVTAEGEKEAELHQKFLCHCKKSGAELKASIAAAEVRIPALKAEIEASGESEKQFTATLKEARADRVAAKATIKEATSIRAKEASSFAAEKSDTEANIAAIKAAVAALERGMAGSFLQTGGAQILRKMLQNKQDMVEEDRQELVSFLSGTQHSEYAPQSGEIVGILKQLAEQMHKGLLEAIATEEEAVTTFKELMSAKHKELEALQVTIESTLEKLANMGMGAVQLENDLATAIDALGEDRKFLAELEKGCATAKADFECSKKTRAVELVALADTIKVLNDDDALELFKKTLPAPTSSLLQTETSGTLRARAFLALAKAKTSDTKNSVQLDLITLALRGKKIGFDKVIKMIDEMIGTLKQEQLDDDNKKEYCNVQFDESDDKRKALERKLSDIGSAIGSIEGSIATLKDEIAALEAGLKALDKAVEEATEQRKEENAAFKELMASDTAAKELLKFAQNRLNKFYAPKLYIAPPKRELSRGDRIFENEGGEIEAVVAGGIAGTGISAMQATPGCGDSYKKNDSKSGVMEMMNLLIADLSKEMAIAETEEKDAQGDFEAMLGDAKAKKEADSNALTEKRATLGDLAADLNTAKAASAATANELRATVKFIASLHAECDWLLKYFDARKAARNGEIDSLVSAKAILSGADYSLIQTKKKSFLRP